MREDIDPSAPYGIEQEVRAGSTTRRDFKERLVAAIKLDPSLYEEVEHDAGALPQALGVVLLASVAAAIGFAGMLGFGSITSAVASGLVTWLVWTGIVWLVGVRIFEHTSSFEELLRTLGFVAAPQLLYLLMIIPLDLFRSLVGLVVLVMTLVAFVRATRHALDVDTMRGLLVAALCVVAHVLLGAAFAAVSSLA